MVVLLAKVCNFFNSLVDFHLLLSLLAREFCELVFAIQFDNILLDSMDAQLLMNAHAILFFTLILLTQQSNRRENQMGANTSFRAASNSRCVSTADCEVA